MSDEDLIRRLRDAASAYPADVLPGPNDHDRWYFANVVRRASAGMGRHFSPLFTAAAEAIERRATPPPDNAGLSRITARQITAAVMQVIANAPEGEIPDTVEAALPALLMRLVPEACPPDNVREAVHALGRNLDVTIEEERELVVVDQQSLCTLIAHLTPAPTTGQRKEST